MSERPDPQSTSYAETLPLPEGFSPGGGESISGESPRVTRMLHALGVTPPPTLEPTGAEAPTVEPGEQLGRYVLGAELGRGGMGRVVEALDGDLRRTVAVKTLNQAADAGRRQLARFVAEARITSQLDHPNIVPVHDIGVSASGEMYFVMKRVRGRSLRAVLDDLRAGEPEALASWPAHRLMTAFQQVCQAVAYAHDRGVVHRDLKPENIMLGEYGEVLVMDWGIARVLGGVEEPIVRDGDGGELAVCRTQDGAVIGTPGWMSPEQARGQLDRIDRRSDVWSLGAILYTLLTFRPPFEERNPLRLMYEAAKGPPEDPRERAPEFDIDEVIAALCLRALATLPEDRPQDASELEAEIEAFLAGSRARAAVLRRRRIGGLAAAVLAVIVTIAGGLVVRAASRVVDAEESLALLAEAARQDTLIALALREEVAGRPDRAAALHRAAARVGVPRETDDLRRLLGPAALRLSLTRGAASAEHLLWTGLESVAVAYADGAVVTWQIDSGGQQVLNGAPAQITGLNLLDGGARLAACEASGRAKVWSAADGVAVGARELGPDCAAPRVTMAAMAGWFASARPGGLVMLGRGLVAATLLGRGGEVNAMAFSPDASRLAVARRDGVLDLWTVGGAGELLEGVGALGADAFIGTRNNLRVCQGSHAVLPVTPYPAVDSVWAPSAICPPR